MSATESVQGVIHPLVCVIYTCFTCGMQNSTDTQWSLTPVVVPSSVQKVFNVSANLGRT